MSDNVLELVVNKAEFASIAALLNMYFDNMMHSPCFMTNIELPEIDQEDVLRCRTALIEQKMITVTESGVLLDEGPLRIVEPIIQAKLRVFVTALIADEDKYCASAYLGKNNALIIVDGGKSGVILKLIDSCEEYLNSFSGFMAENLSIIKTVILSSENMDTFIDTPELCGSVAGCINKHTEILKGAWESAFNDIIQQ